MSAVVSDYELLRQENIKRNQQFLENIGISTVVIDKSNPEPRSLKRPTPQNDVIPSRRSPRLQISMTETLTTDLKMKDSGVDERDNFISSLTISADKAQSRKAKSSTPTVLDPSSSRMLQADLSVFTSKETIGRAIASTKAGVMQIANGGSSIPSFSKYSGVAEWRNAIFLWVNIGSETSEYPNVFTSEGRCITWYGGSQMRSDSRVVERLVASSSGSSNSGSESILLFARLPGQSYVCLGQLSISTFDLETHPVMFVWTLKQFDDVRQSVEFQALLSANGIKQ